MAAAGGIVEAAANGAAETFGGLFVGEHRLGAARRMFPMCGRGSSVLRPGAGQMVGDDSVEGGVRGQPGLDRERGSAMKRRHSHWIETVADNVADEIVNKGVPRRGIRRVDEPGSCGNSKTDGSLFE